MIKVMIVVALSIGLSGCLTLSEGKIVLSDYAQNCRLIKLSRKDTPETQKAILAENNKCRAAVAEQAPTR